MRDELKLNLLYQKSSYPQALNLVNPYSQPLNPQSFLFYL